jgi:electron transfer flavoprotein beta subunit
LFSVKLILDVVSGTLLIHTTMIIKESLGANVTVISVGKENIEPVIRKSLAIGADNAIRINKTPTDSYSVAIEIAHYLKENPVDLIIAGRESTDYNGGAVPTIIKSTGFSFR